MSTHSTFVWHELMTTDPVAATAFYTAVIGWKAQDSGMSEVPYTILSVGETPIGGLMELPIDARANGARPGWIGYIGVDDVDACVAAIAACGGAVLLPPFDIANVGRIAMVSDPQGAAFYVMRGASDEASTACDPERAGHGAWHELHATDGTRATDFYTSQFGWGKSRGVDMGPMGLYQLFSVEGRDLGGIMTNARFPRPAWLVYFRVDGIERAAARISQAGGQVINGPMEVPGGGWIVNGLDPEGAMFALTGTR